MNGLGFNEVLIPKSQTKTAEKDKQTVKTAAVWHRPDGPKIRAPSFEKNGVVGTAAGQNACDTDRSEFFKVTKKTKDSVKLKPAVTSRVGLAKNEFR